MTIKVNLDQWADGASPDAKVLSGSQKDQWQNGNLGGSQAHYNEGEFVPYRMALSGLIEGHTYTVTISWDTTQQGRHALDYIGSYDYSFVGRATETTPLAIDGLTGLLTQSFTNYAIPIDPRVAAGPDGVSGTSDDITQVGGQFTFYGGATITSLGSYSVAGTYGGNSTTSLQITFTYNGDGDAVLNEIGTAVLAWGGHIATRVDWGDGSSAVAISGSPFHMRLDGFTSITDPAEAKNVGQQDRSLSNDAVTFPASIVVHKETTPDGSSQTFNFALERTNSVDVFLGKLDLNGDKLVTTADDGTFRDSGGEIFDITDGVIADRTNDGGDGKINGLTITATTNITNLQGLGALPFILTDGGTKTFGGITDFGSFAVRETLPTNWQLDSVAASENDPINTGDFSGTLANAGAFTLTEGDVWTLTFNNSFVAQPDLSITKTVHDVGGSTSNKVVDAAGDVIHYDIAVTNTGNVALTGLVVTDTLDSSVDEVFKSGSTTINAGDTNNNDAFDAGETWQFAASYTAALADINNNGGGDGDIDNTATADTTETAPKTASASVPITQSPDLSITKTVHDVSGSTSNKIVDAGGDVVNYDIAVTNTGNQTLTGLTVTDTLDSSVDEVFKSGSTTINAGDTNNNDAFDPGETWQFAASYMATLADINNNGGGDGDIDNTATADTNETAPENASASVPITQSVDLSITKTVHDVSGSTSNKVVDAAGDVIHYDIAVANTGNQTLTGLTVTDTLDATVDEVFKSGSTTINAGDTNSNDAFDPGETWQFAASYAATLSDINNNGGGDGDIDNTATADTNETAPENASASVPITRNPDLSITKTVHDVSGSTSNKVVDAAGDVINYNIGVTNTGNQTLTGLVVTDTLDSSVDEVFKSGSATINAGDTNNNDGFDPGETWQFAASYTATLADINNNGGGDGDIDNTATADTNETAPENAFASVPITQSPDLSISKTVHDVSGSTSNKVVDAVGDVINYEIAVTNTGNQTLTGLAVTDTLDSSVDEVFKSGSTTINAGDSNNNDAFDPSETWQFTASYTATQTDLNNNGGGDGDIDNTATADTNETVPESASASVPISRNPSLSIAKTVLNVSGDSVNKLVDAAGDVVNYGISVTNDGNIALTGLTVTDTLDSTVDEVFKSGSTTINAGDTNNNDSFDPGETWQFAASYTATANDLSTNGGGDGDIDNTATADTNETAPESASASVPVFNPVTITGNPQFNFPNDVDKIQPKLQGGSFTLNNGGYIYWDLFTSDKSLAQINTSSATVHSDYNFDVSVREIWTDGTSAIYRLYVANNSGGNISLANSTNIVDYDVIQANGQPVLSTNKGLIDLVNADPIIGNFNNFNNIENALTKDATDHFLTAPGAGTAGIDDVWLSPDESGTATNDTAKTFDALAGNDAVYGGSNNDSLAGSAGNDLIDGRAGNDTISGGAGNDYLYGGLGSDRLVGGDGADTLIGSYGIDSLYGDTIGNESDTGGDIFVLRPGDLDHLPDYDPAEDHIYIWADTLDDTYAGGSPTVSYNAANGELSYNGSLIAFLDPGLTIDTSTLNSFAGDIFVT